MALAVATRAKILLDLVDFGIQDCLDYVSLNLFVSGLKPQIQEEVMRQTPKTLDDAFDMAVQSEKINYAPPKTAGATALPVMPVDQHNTPPPAEENKADFLAALEDIEAENESRVAAIKTKLNKFRCNGQSSGNLPSANKNSNKSSSGAQPRQRCQVPLLQQDGSLPTRLPLPKTPWTCPEWLKLMHLCSTLPRLPLTDRGRSYTNPLIIWGTIKIRLRFFRNQCD